MRGSATREAAPPSGSDDAGLLARLRRRRPGSFVLPRLDPGEAAAVLRPRVEDERETEETWSAHEEATELARRQAGAADAARLAQARAELAAQDALADRESAHREARAQAKAAEAAEAARVEAEARAQALAASLEEARTELLAAERARLVAVEAENAGAAEREEPEQQTEPEPDTAPEPIRPADVPDHVEIGTRGGAAAAITVALGAAALVAAGVTVYLAYLDRLASTAGIVAAVATVLLVVVVTRTRVESDRVWLEQGVLHVEEGETHRRFDLTTPDTIVEMVGAPGERRWKVLLLRKDLAPYEVNARLVDPEDFLAAVLPYRPRLRATD